MTTAFVVNITEILSEDVPDKDTARIGVRTTAGLGILSIPARLLNRLIATAINVKGQLDWPDIGRESRIKVSDFDAASFSAHGCVVLRLVASPDPSAGSSPPPGGHMQYALPADLCERLGRELQARAEEAKAVA